MRRSVPRLLTASVLIILVLGLIACGGGGSGVTPTTVTIAPANISLNTGQVFQASVSAVDKNNAVVSGDFTWTSDNQNILTVSTNGSLCAGKWDDKFIVCTPATTTGTANLTATLKGVSNTVKVYVHQKIDRVAASNTATGCASMTETQQLVAKAYSNDPAVCGGASSCELPASSVGPAQWVSADTTVVTIDNTADKAGLATAGIPGRATVYANLSGVNSPNVGFDTCAVKSIQLAIQNSNASTFSVAKAVTQTLTVTVVDTKGTTLTSPPVSWLSSQPFAITVAGTSTVTTGTATAANPGVSTLVASCTPPVCNKNLSPVYSNPIIGTVTGSAGATIYAASTDSTSLVPIDGSNNTAGTAVTLSKNPDSFVINPQGNHALLGNSSAVMVLDPASNVITNGTRAGTALASTPDGTRIAVMDATSKVLTGYLFSTGQFDPGVSFDPPATHASAALDSSSFFVANGTNSYYSLFPNSTGIGTLSAPINDVAVSGNGSLAYLAGGTAAGIDVRAVCNNAELDTQVASNPKLVAALPNGSGAVVVDDTSLVYLHDANVTSGCPPTVSESRSAIPLGITGYTARQLLVTPDSSKALVSTDKGLVVVNLSSLTPTTVTTTGTFTGGVTLDSKTAYFGAADGAVHRIDISGATPSDAQQITVGLKKSDGSAANPNLVVVRNK